MTGLPKKKMSRTRSLKRKGAIKVSLPELSKCPACNKPKFPHTVCSYCGNYKNKQAVDISIKTKVVKESSEKKD